jgi:hypothetical protein
MTIIFLLAQVLLIKISQKFNVELNFFEKHKIINQHRQGNNCCKACYQLIFCKNYQNSINGLHAKMCLANIGHAQKCDFTRN